MNTTRHVTGTASSRFAALALILAAVAATPAMAGPSWSLRGGFSSGQFDGTLGQAVPSAATSGAMGIAAGLPLTPWLSMQPELLWLRKGGRYAATALPTQGPSVMFGGTYELDYVELPVLLRAEPASASFVRPYLFAGSAAAWRVAGSVKQEIRESPPLPVDVLRFANIFEGVGTFADHFRRFDVDLVAGTGFAFGRGPVTAEIEGRYYHGLIDLLPDDFADGYNRTWSVTAGFRIH